MEFRINKNETILICLSETEPEAVKIAVQNLERDLKQVFRSITVIHENATEQENCTAIHITTDNTGEYTHKETYSLSVREGILYISGSDRRGTVYGIYTFCEMLGVSPWYFFADVPIKQRKEFVLPEGYSVTDWPSVEYRGIFINDEEELDAWVRNYLQEPTIGLKAYEKIFELLLRLKGNYIWPAMHVNSFNMNPENGALADRMGIVVGTSHCDMLMRSNNREWAPWTADKGYTDAKYDYSIDGRNREILKEYWRESVEQNRDYEVCYTLGMRGIHDSGFSTSDLAGKTEDELIQAKVELLNTIIRDQQKILKDTLAGDTMMTFIPYKEVLRLYDRGLEVPEELTLVWANDNFGYIRRYPDEKEKKRKGGNGIYYHNSYWGATDMSYLFCSTIPLAHTRNELQKAWNEGIRKLWVLNVGSLKRLEQEVSYYLSLAWEIGKTGALTEDVEAFVEDWINRTFSGNLGSEVSKLLCDFGQLNNVRKVENMDYDAFSQTAYGDEAVVRINKFEEMFRKGNALYERVSLEEKDAFFQIVLMRIHAAYFTNLSYYYGDRSTLMYQRGNMQAAAEYSRRCRDYDDVVRNMVVYYNSVMSGGKWNGIMDPEGFPPPRKAMLPTCTPPLKISGNPAVRVDLWNDDDKLEFVSLTQKWIDIGNTGAGELDIEIHAPQWLEIFAEAGKTQKYMMETGTDMYLMKAVISDELRVCVKVKNPLANRHGQIVIRSLTENKEVCIPVYVLADGKNCQTMEEDGVVVLDGEAFCRDETVSRDFHVIRRLGRGEGNLVEACLNKDDNLKEGDAEWFCNRIPLKYHFMTRNSGEYLLEILRFPSLDSTGRIRIGIALDNGPIQVVESLANDEWRSTWQENVIENVDRLYVNWGKVCSGNHILSVYAVDSYFAFSGMRVYTQPYKPNNLVGIEGEHILSGNKWLKGWCESFYGVTELYPRPEYYVAPENIPDSLENLRIVQAEKYAKTITPDWYLKKAGEVFTEKAGKIEIDAATALADNENAWCTGDVWKHCAGESFGRSGLCMLVRSHKMHWSDEVLAPALHYRFSCEGGEYTVWMLIKYNDGCFTDYRLGLDSKVLAKKEMLCTVYMQNVAAYSTEQIYHWVPLTKQNIEKGEHVLDIYSMSSGIRFNRFFLTTGSDFPPMDLEWLHR